MDNEVMVNLILHDIRHKLTKFFLKDFYEDELIILIPKSAFDVLSNYVAQEFTTVCEKPTVLTDSKNYLWGIEIKKVNDIDDIYVSLK